MAAALITTVSVLNAWYFNIKANTADNFLSKFYRMPNDIEVCNFGSSHGYYGFIYSDYDDSVTTFNFATESQSLIYDDKLLNYYKSHLARGAVVFIPISYSSFIGKPENQREGFLSRNKRYYTILPNSYIVDYDAKTDFFQNFPLLVDYGMVAYYVFNSQSATEKSDDYPKVEQTADDIDLVADVEATYLRHHVTNMPVVNGELVISQERVDALYDMIYLCKEIGARPVLVTTPFLSEYNNEYLENDPYYLTKHREFINEICEETGVEYYDYSFDERFVNDHSLFMNGDHLNYNGAVKFTDILMEEVVNI